MNAGSDGPMRMSLMPRCSSVSRIATAFCSYQLQDHRQRQVVDVALERLGQSDRDLDRRVGVVALADVHESRQAADLAELLVEEAELAACQRQNDGVGFGVSSTNSV